jgi:hypothetical protein
MSRLAIVGSRYYNDKKALADVVNVWIAAHGAPEHIVTGDASGADALARDYATQHGIKLIVHKADWAQNGRAAGPIRNGLIVKDCTAMIAFPLADSKGTQDSITKAKRAGIEPMIVEVQAERQRDDKKRKAVDEISVPAKKAEQDAPRMPTFEEAQELFLKAGELALLSKTTSYTDINGAFVTLKIHDGLANTTVCELYEVASAPESDAPYRPYKLEFDDIVVDRCTAGVVLVGPSPDMRRSLGNIAHGDLTEALYRKFIASRRFAHSHYPATPAQISARIARVRDLRAKLTKK